MFVGHFSVAFVAQRVEPRVLLWALLLAAQLVDVAWALLLAGRERASLNASLPSNPLVLEHMPYSHSLLATGLWAPARPHAVGRPAENRPGLVGSSTARTRA